MRHGDHGRESQRQHGERDRGAREVDGEVDDGQYPRSRRRGARETRHDDGREGDADGIECLCLIKRAAPRLPVVMLTGHASLQSSILGMEQGASNYCLKPIDIEDLIEKIVIACKEAGD